MEFGDVLVKCDPKYHYYLFYDVGGNRTFHTPIEQKNVQNYNLEIIDIKELQTEGHDTAISHLDGSVIDYFEEHVEQIRMGEFNDKEYARVKLDFIEGMIERWSEVGGKDIYRVGNKI